MTPTTPEKTYASDAGHWYRPDGTPCYEIAAASGKGMRPTTLRDAKKLGLVPSVTTILRLLSKPALDIWKQKQVMMSALTMPRHENETDADFCNRILEEGKEAARIAAERGTALHTAIEKALQNQPQTEWQRHIDATFAALREVGIDPFTGTIERSFAHPDGFGGRIDLSSDAFILDFKSKDAIEDGKKMAYDEHVLQLSSYQKGIGGSSSRRLLNVFIGVEDCKVHIHEWTAAEASLALRKFDMLLAYWKLQNTPE